MFLNHFLGFDGFNEGVLPGVCLLSLCRLSGFPVESAILLGPGLSAIISKFIFFLIIKFNQNAGNQKLPEGSFLKLN